MLRYHLPLLHSFSPAYTVAFPRGYRMGEDIIPLVANGMCVYVVLCLKYSQF